MGFPRSRIAISPPWGYSRPGDESGSPALHADFLPTEPPPFQTLIEYLNRKISKNGENLTMTLSVNWTQWTFVEHSPNKTRYVFFSDAWRTLTNINHIWGHKANLNRYDSNHSLFSNHHGIDLAINIKDIWRIPKYLEWNKTFLNSLSQRKRWKKLKIILTWMKLKTQNIRNCEMLLK